MPSPPSTTDTSAGETRAREPLKAVPGTRHPASAAVDSRRGRGAEAPPRETSGSGAPSLLWVLLSSTVLLRSSP